MPSCVIIWRVCGAGRVVFHAVSRRLYGMSSCLCMLGIGDSDIVGNILVAQRILKISLIHDIHHSRKSTISEATCHGASAALYLKCRCKHDWKVIEIMENMASMGWLQVGTLFVGILGLGLAGMVYLTRQFNRLADRVGNLEQGQARLEGRFDRMDDRLDRMDERFDRMDDRLDRMDDRLDRMEKDVRQLRIDVSQLQVDVSQLQVEVRQLRGDVNQLQVDVSQLQSDVSQLQVKVSQLQSDMSQMRGEMKMLGEGLQNVEKEQARMLGFLEGRGVMGKAPAPDIEAVP